MPITTRKIIAARDLPSSPNGAYADPSGRVLRFARTKRVNTDLVFMNGDTASLRVDEVSEWDVTTPTPEETLEERAAAVLDYTIRGIRSVRHGSVRDTAQKIVDVADNPWNVDSFAIEQLITARAHALVSGRLEAVMRHKAYTSLTTAVEKVHALCAFVLNEVTSWYGRRSTSTISNIMDESVHVLWVSILRDLKEI